MGEHVQREVLPIPDRNPVNLTTYDAKDPDTSFPPIKPLRPPEGAPNVLVVLLDDVGFGASHTFGGPANTPALDRLAENGLRYTRFHTTSLCAPTRAALLSGRNHHTVGMGVIGELATSAPGYSSLRPNTCAPLAEVLKLNGYSTAQFGKCHEVPVWESSPLGRSTLAAGGGGFEYFYGFIGGETNQYAPSLYEGMTRWSRRRLRRRATTSPKDLADRAIEWIRQQKALMPDKPFFVYFAPGATHAPHHVPPEWSAVPGPVRSGVGCVARGNLRAAEKARRGAAGSGADRPAGGDPRLGRHPRGIEAGVGAADGGVRRLPGAHRLPRRPTPRRSGRSRPAGRHPGLRHGRRQRSLRRRHHQRHIQRTHQP